MIFEKKSLTMQFLTLIFFNEAQKAHYFLDLQDNPLQNNTKHTV